jgi:indole-3-glycerol phosphate synthase
LQDTLSRIVAHKRTEIAAARAQRPIAELQSRLGEAPPVRDFVAGLKAKNPVALIAEVKKASPSAGLIRADFDPIGIARTYERSGANCLSVLTDEHFFQGHLDFLTAIRREVSIPVLRKDFILDEYQVIEARAAGADAVLLIAECLPGRELADLHAAILELGMTPLVELYDAENLDRVLALNPRLVGVNNRDLRTFVTDINRAIQLHERVPHGIPFVAESGIRTAADVARLREAGIDAMLVGESLMRQADIAQAVTNLLSLNS